MNDAKSSEFPEAESNLDAAPEQIDDVLSSAADSLAEAEAVMVGSESADDPWAVSGLSVDTATTVADSPWGVITESDSESVAAAVVEASAASSPVNDGPQAIVPVSEPAVAAVAAEQLSDEGDRALLATDASVADAAPDTIAVSEVSEVQPQLVAESETVVFAPQPSAASINPIFIQAPEPPHARGNRAFSALVGLVATVAFALIYGAAALGVMAVEGELTAGGFVDSVLGVLASVEFWIPVITFFVAFWLLGAIINRGRWAYWVIFGLLIGVAAYGGHILGELWAAPFWLLTPSAALELVKSQLLAPLAIVAFVAARELTIWFGAWVAARARKISALNLEDQLEYERQLEAGPQLP